jgi:hypothetical protein
MVETGDFNILAFPEVEIVQKAKASKVTVSFIAQRSYARYLWNHLLMNAAIQMLGM